MSTNVGIISLHMLTELFCKEYLVCGSLYSFELTNDAPFRKRFKHSQFTDCAISGTWLTNCTLSLTDHPNNPSPNPNAKPNANPTLTCLTLHSKFAMVKKDHVVVNYAPYPC